ncbi:hypothetical protein AaE_002309, partial [Aphanomyces astaci]
MVASLFLQSTKETKGRLYWRMPKELLLHTSIRKYITQEATVLAEKIVVSDNPSRKLHTRLRSRYTQELANINTRLKTAIDAHTHGSLDDIGLEQARSVHHTETQQLLQHKSDANFDFHSTNTETSSSHFFRRPVTKLYHIPINRIELPTGEVSDNPMDIHLGFEEHWGTIMGDPTHHTPTAPPCVEAQRAFLQTNVTRKLDASQQEYMDSDVTPHELSAAIKHMAPHKSPGPDGFPAAFFQIAPDHFAICLAAVFQERLRKGIMLPYQRNAAVTLLFKAGKRARPGNYRPIALIPVEVKVLSKALACRLSSVLGNLIHPSQTGFVKGRSIQDHIHFVRDLQHWCTDRDEHCFAAFLDFQKAFDRVNWSYLWATMTNMNFGPKYIQW